MFSLFFWGRGALCRMCTKWSALPGWWNITLWLEYPLLTNVDRIFSFVLIFNPRQHAKQRFHYLHCSLSVCLFVCVSVCLSVCLSVCVFVYVSVYLPYPHFSTASKCIHSLPKVPVALLHVYNVYIGLVPKLWQ